ncbi:MAG: cyclic nucleotide-binding domain-containing protein [bacterium]|nr:cyclic nucleotide-binding domain-containing protein [bacterium]
MLSVVEKVMLLQNVDVFTDLKTEQLSYLAAIAEEVSYSADESIYKIDDPSDSLYVVLDGRVRLHRGDEEISVASASDPFGTWALFDTTPRVTSATAVADSRLLYIDREDFLDLLSDHVQVTEAVMNALVRRLRDLLARVGADITSRNPL